MAYTKENIIEEVKKALENPATLYRSDFLNYRGNVNGERYTEIAAREILKIVPQQNLSALGNIKPITRLESYKTASHNDYANRERLENSKRDEEWIAIGMYGKALNFIGKIIDFQTPLKNTADNNVGKIDLLSYNKSENTAYILELKKPDSEETLLRCALEVYTYWKIVDKEKLLRDFKIEGAELRKAVLVYKSCLAYKDFIGGECDAVYNLMTGKLGVDLFVLNDESDNVIEGFTH